MRMNENTVICGDKVILVPYRAEHVPTYHEWMKSPELLELTASEPLSFDEELDMQRKWRDDDDKLTFILLERPAEFSPTDHALITPSELPRCKMVGDVNLFLPDGPAEDVECEIMIADPNARRKGLAQEALTVFLTYAIHSQLHIAPASLIARIGAKNTASIRLFERLGFGTVKLVEVWQEVEMRWGWKGEDAPAPAKEDDLARWPVSCLEGRTGVYASA